MKNINFNSVMILILLISSQFYYGQFKVFFAGESSSKSQKSFIKNNNLIFLDFFYEDEFVTNVRIDFKKLNESLNNKFPMKDTKAYLVLDWEGKVYDDLWSKNNYKESMSQFISAIDFIKKNRPNIKVGYYGIPSREFWNADAVWQNKNLLLAPLYKKVDFLANSVYMFYTDSEVKSVLNTNYIKQNVELALTIGKKFNKPVYPVIWHRYHPSNQHFGLMNIPLQSFRTYINDILETEVQGKKVSGVFWWQADIYYRKTEINNKNLKKEYSEIKNFDEYDVKLFKKYLNVILQIASSKSY